MSLLDTASLLLTPNAYKEGKLYSVIPSDGSGDFTFTRATTATRVNSDGLVELVPYNLVRYSEEFDNAAWVKAGTTISTNTTTAPDGTLTADTINLGAGGFANIRQAINCLSNTSYTVSCYYKNIALTSGQTFEMRYTNELSSPNNFNAIATIDLFAGTVSSDIFGTFGTGFSGSVSSSISSVGNDWYRVTMTFTVGTSGASTSAIFRPGVIVASVARSFYAWGAQLVEGTNALPYQKTETRLNIPRLDYSLGGCPNILLEPQRTNLALQSNALTTIPNIVDWSTTTANVYVSPDGTQNAMQFTEKTTNDRHGFYQYTNVTAQAYTASIFTKQTGRRYIACTSDMTGTVVTSYFDLQTKSVVSSGSGYTCSIEDFENGWFRLIVTFTATAGSRFVSWGGSPNGTTNSYAGSTSISQTFYGYQLEAGSYATSYIPTTTASVTRNRDQCVKTGISSLIGQTEGTLFVNAIGTKNVQATAKFLMQILGSKNISITFYAGNINVYSQLVDLSVPFTPNQIYKIAVCYSNSGNFRLFVNGVKTHDVNTYASGTYSDLGIGCRTIGDITAETSINSAQLYKTALTDDECIQLTTL